MKPKKIITLVCLLVVLVAGFYSVKYGYDNIAVTYDGSDTDVTELYDDPDTYDVSDPDGVADIIVQENLSKTMAANNVAAVVFDYRAFDTLGESFILLTAIAGTFVIISRVRKKKGEDEE